MHSTDSLTNPFPGLRPFNEAESHLFFGREGQTDELLRRLRQHRFLAVVGTSGSGKSSLVRAGLLPSLHRGFMTQAGSSWRIAVFRPGDSPIANLANALCQSNTLGSPLQDLDLQQMVMDTTLRRGSLGLVDAVMHAQLPPQTNVLVVVDQFEELFRFKQRQQSTQADTEAAAFVKLLIAAAQDAGVPIYVVLTMRSDFLGDCAQFRELPETINESQYLIPRMTWQQRQQAIEGPIAIGQGQITTRLVNRLLNDVGDNPDQLPVLQHALMRTWNAWLEDEQPESGLDLQHYESIGGMEQALSKHADEIYHQLPDDRARQITETLFKCLTEKGTDNRGIRRPTRLSEVMAVAEASLAEVKVVVDAFRGQGKSFIMPPIGADPATMVDISHESLMRVWDRLRVWVSEEAQSAQRYRRLLETVAMFEAGQARLLQDPELTLALEWLSLTEPNATWAERYQSGLEDVNRYLEESAKARDAELTKQEAARQEELDRLAREAALEKQAAIRQRRFTMILAGMSALMLGIAIFAVIQGEIAKRQRINTDTLLQSLEVDNLFRSHLEIEALMKGIKGGRQLQDNRSAVDADTRLKFNSALAEIIGSIREQNRLEGHDSSVNSVIFSPDGETLALASSDNTVKLWSTKGQLLRTLEGHDSEVLSVSFSPDGETIASASWDNTVKLWSIKGQLLRTLEGHDSEVSSVSFSPDGETIASASWDNTVKLWSIKGQLLRTLEGHDSEVSSVIFSPDGETLASASSDNTVKLWSIKGQLLRTLEGHDNAVSSVIFSPDGETLASASFDDTVKLWSTKGQLLRTLEGHDNYVLSVIFSPDGETLASASFDNTVKLWSTKGQLLRTLEGHDHDVNSVIFSPDGETLASASGDNTVKLWSTKGQLLRTLEGHDSYVNSVIFSPDGETLASASSKTVKLWSTKGQLLRTLEGHDSYVNSVIFSPDGETLASASFDNTVKLWSTKGQLLRTLEGHDHDVNSVIFSPDGETLASASGDNTVKLWSTKGQLLRTLEGHDSEVNSVIFSPDGETLASASSDNTVKLWNFNLDELLRQGCGWLNGYLQNNPNVNEEERKVCDGIPQ